MIRRLIYAFIIVFVDNAIIQVFLSMISSLCILAFILVVKPMNTHILNCMEVINEATFLLFTYLCLLYTDYLE